MQVLITYLVHNQTGNRRRTEYNQQYLMTIKLIAENYQIYSLRVIFAKSHASKIITVHSTVLKWIISNSKRDF